MSFTLDSRVGLPPEDDGYKRPGRASLFFSHARAGGHPGFARGQVRTGFRSSLIYNNLILLDPRCNGPVSPGLKRKGTRFTKKAGNSLLTSKE